MHLHILGIAGTFMGGLAAIAQTAGHTVTGCDANIYPPMSNQLRDLGIQFVEGFSADQLSLRPDVFVIGNVVTRGNPLMEAILNEGLPYVSGPQWLADNVLHDRWVLAVAGTHGKTTTTSMLAHILQEAGLNPGFLIGGVPLDFPVSARLTDTPHFVIEADEYDCAFFDKRSKFVHYRPRTAILNNLEYDHADIFPDLAAIERQFHHLVRTIAQNGRLVVNNREPALQRVLAMGAWTPIEFFGDAPGWHVREDGYVKHGDVSFGRLALDLPGDYNQLNALAAVAAANHVGVRVGDALAALKTFKGVKRRLESRGVVNRITVYDDFAHHPTAVRVTLQGLRERMTSGRLIAVLEPRSNTMKQGAMKAQLPEAMGIADKSFVYAGSASWNVAEAMAPLGDRVTVSQDLEKLVSAIAREARPEDHVVVMSNGGFGGIHEKLLAALAVEQAAARG